MLEFTGERVIPGQVDADLYNEHMARYLFAARYASGTRCLDAGCGVGYGAEHLATVSKYTLAVDHEIQAVSTASAEYQRPNLRFVVGDVCALPVQDGSFDLTVSFEVLEHLEPWPAFLKELRRVTAPGGQVIISTPNRTYYNQSRGDAGPNPFHFQEFTYEEFRTALEAHFAYVNIFTQNHSPAITVSGVPAESTAECLLGITDSNPDDAQFFLGICSQQPIPAKSSFAHIPNSGNVLAERERHIALLKQEVALKASWLEGTQRELQELAEAHQKLDEEHRERSKWALETISRMEKDNKLLATELENAVQSLKKTVDSLHETEQIVEERTQWARRLDAEIHELYSQRSELLARVEELSKQLEDRSTHLLDTESRLHALDHKRLIELRGIADALEVSGVDTIADSDRLMVDVLQAAEDMRRILALVDSLRASRWLKLGRAIGVGPNLEGSKPLP